jgi:outer membrane phospholipase A
MRTLLALLALPCVWAVEDNHAEMSQALFPYEPTYFAIDPGWDGAPVNTKFQLSFAFRLFGSTNTDNTVLRPEGLYFAYSQTSFWDLQSESKPFYDSSYRPEIWWHQQMPDFSFAHNLGVEPGIGHESNGRSGVDSRSINHVFVRFLGEWRKEDLILTASPRVRAYIEESDNPDIQRYRGYVDLVGSLRKVNSWELRATARVGSEFDRGSLMLELSHPTNAWTGDWLKGFFYVQSFTGYSETLLSYNKNTPQPRILFGFAITR